jgi:hypothetical protein
MNKETLYAILFWGAIALCVIGYYIYQNSPDHKVSQSYWYCWNSGAPQPHHLGYHVSGDHYCTDKELQDSGVK